MPKLSAGDSVGMPVTIRPEHLGLIDPKAAAARPEGLNRAEVTDLTGRTFGRLIVRSRAANNGRGNAQWLCQCSCGSEIVVQGSSLRRQATRSCGCLRREAQTRGHGGTGTLLYRKWIGMRGRGGDVCEAWRNFATFRAWAVANGYRDGMRISCIDSGEPWSPDNCRWTSRRLKPTS
jgi:hypothetical protein